ncbi:hypothetical protein [Lactobacillus phage JCL1032]|nr:hypothetical protein F367_gp41 [Lactobacillus phage JCL1032]ACB72581.1 hypothetical protein [Lactobacillus phage JCL1032]
MSKETIKLLVKASNAFTVKTKKSWLSKDSQQL